MRKGLLVTLALGAALCAVNTEVAQAWGWERDHRHRSARVFGYGPVYAYGPTIPSRPPISRYGPVAEPGGYETSSVKLAPSWWREPRRR
jgi:hypothetical protein